MRRAMFAAALASCAALAGCDRGKAGAPAPAQERGPTEPATGAPASATTDAALATVPPAAEPRGVLAVHVMSGSAHPGEAALRFNNRSTKPIATLDLRVYFYDVAGKQLRAPLAITKTPVRPIRPRQLRELEIDLGDVPAGARVEAVVPHVIFVDHTEWRDDAIAPEERPMGG